MLFNHQGVKASLNRPQVLNELNLLRQEYQRNADIHNYSVYVANSGAPVQEHGTNYVVAQGHMGVEELADEAKEAKKINEFTLQALNGILQLLEKAA